MAAPSGPLERQADRMAEHALLAPWLPRRETGADPGAAAPAAEAGTEIAPASVGAALARAGQPLGAGVRHEMQQRFGFDFSRVRVHADDTAARSARDARALAYTVGNEIVFGSGQYAPATARGRHLIAHELAHVVQQSSGVARQVQRLPAACATLLTLPQTPGGVSGRLVHERIAEHFRRSVAGARNVSIPGASAAPLRSQALCGADSSVIKPQVGRSGPGTGRGGAVLGSGIPDLARQLPDGGLEVAEIKPAAAPCLVDGLEQLGMYISHGNAPDPQQQRWRDSQGIRAVIPMLASTYLPPPLIVGACPVLTAWCAPGMMVYALQCPPGVPVPVPVPVPQEQLQEQEAPSKSERSTLRLPQGPFWEWAFGIIMTLGVLAMAVSLWGKVGALLGLLARALGFTLGLLAGGAAAAAGGPGSPGTKGSGTPAPGGGTEPAAPARTTTPGPGKAASTKPPQPGPATSQQQPAARRIDVIEGINLESLRVGEVLPLRLSDLKSRHDIAILLVTRVESQRGETTVEFRALQEAGEEQVDGSRPVVLMGHAYTVTHPNRAEKSKLVGLPLKVGPDPKWVWDYLERLATKLKAAGHDNAAATVRAEVQRQQVMYAQAARAKGR
jgi:Domain of unknown function (DUF4157)